MNVPQDALDAIARAEAEGRVTEQGKLLVYRPTDDCPEHEFQRGVIALAKRHGWMCYHTHDSRRSEAGFPDLVLVRERIVYAELKAAGGRLKRQQAVWLAGLLRAGAEAYTWRPADWPEIERILTQET